MVFRNRAIISLAVSMAVVLPFVVGRRVCAQELPETGILGTMRPGGSPFAKGMGKIAGKLGAAGGGSEAAATAQARAALGREPTRDEVYYLAALDCQARRDTKGFFEYMNTAIRLAPYNWVYRSSVGDQYRKMGKREAAIGNYLAAAKAAEMYDKAGAPITRKWAADLLRQTGKLADSERSYEKSLAQFSAFAPQIEQRMSNERSRRAWTAAQSDAKGQLLAVKQKLAKFRPAAAWVARVMPWAEATPGSDPAVVARPGVATPNNVDLLIESLAALELNAKDAAAWQMLGLAYLRQGRLAEAANAYGKACRLGNTASCEPAQMVLESMARLRAVSGANSRATGKGASASKNKPKHR